MTFFFTTLRSYLGYAIDAWLFYIFFILIGNLFLGFSPTNILTQFFAIFFSLQLTQNHIFQNEYANGILEYKVANEGGFESYLDTQHLGKTITTGIPFLITAYVLFKNEALSFPLWQITMYILTCHSVVSTADLLNISHKQGMITGTLYLFPLLSPFFFLGSTSLQDTHTFWAMIALCATVVGCTHVLNYALIKKIFG